MLDAGWEIEVPGFRGRDAGCWMLDARWEIEVSGVRCQGGECWGCAFCGTFWRIFEMIYYKLSTSLSTTLNSWLGRRRSGKMTKLSPLARAEGTRSPSQPSQSTAPPIS